jgi:hypothetical protein
VIGLTNVTFEKDRPCAACQAGKQVGGAHHSKNVMTTSRPLELYTGLSGEPTVGRAIRVRHVVEPTVGRGHRTVRCAPNSVRCANGSKTATVGFAK